MKDRLELEIGPDGIIRTIYRDGIEKLADELGGDVSTVCRASHVEFEEVDGRKGWTVRSAKDPEVALRVSDWCRWLPKRHGTIVTFATREEALTEEVAFFWELMHGEADKSEEKERVLPNP